MKNMKIYRGVTALTLATSITLLTGCTGKPQENIEAQQPKETAKPVEFYLSDEQEELEQADKKHKHLIVYFGDQAIILRECEGYSINTSFHGKNGKMHYSITFDDATYLNNDDSSRTNNYNFYYSDHNDFIEEVENLAIEKGAKVLKIK